MKRRMIRDIQACFQCIYCKEVEGLHSYHYICTKHNKYSGQILIGGDQRKELDAINKWVSTNDFLPERMTEVLVEVEGHRNPMWRNNHNVVAYLSYRNEWIIERTNEKVFGVTHWRHLPKPPIALMDE